MDTKAREIRVVSDLTDEEFALVESARARMVDATSPDAIPTIILTTLDNVVINIGDLRVFFGDYAERIEKLRQSA